MKKLILLLLLIPAITFAQMTREFKTYDTDGNYAVYTPPSGVKIEGVILYFHGKGEKGNTIADYYKIENNEIPKLFRLGIVKPYIVICAQLKTQYTGDWPTSVLNSMLVVADNYKAQGYDIHVTGLSLGGIACHAIAKLAYAKLGNKPGYFKTIGAVCGRVNYPDSVWYKKSFVKLWHGIDDTTLRIATDYKLYDSLSHEYNLDPTIPDSLKQIQRRWYLGLGHNIWGIAYNNDKESYWKWLSDVTAPPQPVEIVDKVISFEIINGTKIKYTTESGNIYYQTLN